MTATFFSSTGIGDNPGYAFTALAVAKGIMGARHGGIGPAIVLKIEDFGNDPVLVRADQLRGARCHPFGPFGRLPRSEEHTSELQSLMRISYAVFCLKNKNITFYFLFFLFFSYLLLS